MPLQTPTSTAVLAAQPAPAVTTLRLTQTQQTAPKTLPTNRIQPFKTSLMPPTPESQGSACSVLTARPRAVPAPVMHRRLFCTAILVRIPGSFHHHASVSNCAIPRLARTKGPVRSQLLPALGRNLGKRFVTVSSWSPAVRTWSPAHPRLVNTFAPKGHVLENASQARSPATALLQELARALGNGRAIRLAPISACRVSAVGNARQGR